MKYFGSSCVCEHHENLKTENSVINFWNINPSAIEAGEFELKPIEFNKENRRFAVVMIFVNHYMDIETTKVAEMTVVLSGPSRRSRSFSVRQSPKL